MIKQFVNIIFFILIGWFSISCSHSKTEIENDLSKRFEKGMEYFEKGKYKKSKEEFDFIVMNNPGSRLAVDAQYYLAESLFYNKKYIEATVAYDQYIRYSNDLDKIEHARFRICECAINTSYPYQKDQESTLRALDQLQGFIEDFPNSKLVPEASAKISEIRLKLARKLYETGRLYLKLEEYESATIYFSQVLDLYYDTPIADEARISIMFTYILKGDHESAESYLRMNKNNFLSDQSLKEAQQILNNTSDGKMTLEEYIRLYK